MAMIEFTVSNLKPLIIDTITNTKGPITEKELMETLECTYTKRAYALGRAVQQLITENKIRINQNDHKIYLIVETMEVTK